MGGSGSSERDDQSAGDPRGLARHRSPRQRRHQRQHHVALRPGSLSAGRRGVSRGSRVARRPQTFGPGGFGRELLPQPHRCPRRRGAGRARTRRSPRARACCAAAGRSRDRERARGVSDVHEDDRGRSVQSFGSERRSSATTALGQHEHQESQLQRREVLGGAHRRRHDRHGSTRDVGRLPRSRQAGASPRA